MHTVLAQPAARETPDDRRRRCWPLAVAGLALLVASVIMMVIGAQPSRAQAVRPHLAPTRLAPLRQLAPLRLPAPTGRYQVGTVALHLIDRSRPNPWVASPLTTPRKPAHSIGRIVVRDWHAAGGNTRVT